MGRRILVVEDEATIADAVAARLRSEGYEVAVARDGLTGVDLAASWHPDLVLLDLMLPGLDGLEVCRRIQKAATSRCSWSPPATTRPTSSSAWPSVPTTTSTKPFSMRELVARVQAILRRVDALAGAPPIPDRHLGDIDIDVAGRRVYRGGELVHLTPTEFDLLVALVERPGRVLTRERLLVEVWGYRDGSGARTVDSHVRALRRKLGDEVVRTVHGVGYTLGEAEPDVEPEPEPVSGRIDGHG